MRRRRRRAGPACRIFQSRSARGPAGTRTNLKRYRVSCTVFRIWSVRVATRPATRRACPPSPRPRSCRIRPACTPTTRPAFLRTGRLRPIPATPAPRRARPQSRTRPSSRPSQKRGSTAIGRRTSSRSGRRSCSRHTFSSSRCNCSCTCSRPSSTRPASASSRNCPSSSPTNYMCRTHLLFCTTPGGDWPSCMPPGTCSPLLSSARRCGPPPRAAGGAGACCRPRRHSVLTPAPSTGMSSGLPGQAGSPWQAN
mmetsp:Transcript_7928/g.22273  ORF Transcript_7928/g.22273 Transcript_7928/m.22273 type:complete len:253 (-) Transcript_7928:13-771(-)